MANSLPPVQIPANTWVNLYAATGITVGAQLSIQNMGYNSAYLTESASEPAQGLGRNMIEQGAFLTNSAGNIGSWAYSGGGTSLQVEET